MSNYGLETITAAVIYIAENQNLLSLYSQSAGRWVSWRADTSKAG